MAREHGWTPAGQDRLSNERAWRKAGMSERQDRTHIEKDMALGILSEIDRLHPRGRGGVGLEEYPEARPMAHRVWARRRARYASATSAGLTIPEVCDRPGLREGLLYDVIAVGPGVFSVKVGDCIVVNSCLGLDLGDLLGEGVYQFVADVEHIEPRQYETETSRHTELGEPLPDGVTRTFRRRMSDTERVTGGMILAILEE